MAQPPLTPRPGAHGPAALSPHDPAWHRRAAELLDAVRTALAPLDPEHRFDHDHIGSTAVPGLVAKPYLDLQVRVPVLPDVDVLVTALQGIGFRREHGSRPDSPGVTADTPRGDLSGVTDPAVWHKRLFVASAEVAAPASGAVLHVRRTDSPWAAQVMAFRDLLRADAAVRARYEAVKRGLADTHAADADYDDYTRGKTAFFDAIQPLLDTRSR